MVEGSWTMIASRISDSQRPCWEPVSRVGFLFGLTGERTPTLACKRCLVWPPSTAREELWSLGKLGEISGFPREGLDTTRVRQCLNPELFPFPLTWHLPDLPGALPWEVLGCLPVFNSRVRLGRCWCKTWSELVGR